MGFISLRKCRATDLVRLACGCRARVHRSIDYGVPFVDIADTVLRMYRPCCPEHAVTDLTIWSGTLVVLEETIRQFSISADRSPSRTINANS